MNICKNINTMRYFSKKKFTPLTLNYIYNFGKNKTPETLLQQSIFLHQELPIRLAQRAIELEQLPYEISNTNEIQSVYNLYLDSFNKIRSYSISGDSEKFIKLLADIKNAHHNIEYNIADAINNKYNKEAEAILNNFYSSRIGIRFLIGQHVELHNNSLSENVVGIINPKCNPHQIINDAISEVKTMITQIYDCDLEIECDFIQSKPCFLYIPSHLYYIVLEILKNAGRATAESLNKPIKIQTSISKNDFIIKITDHGCGIERNMIDKIFSFSYTDANKTHESNGIKIAGYGHGVGLARIYSRYFGGDLRVASAKRLGTDVYIYINRLGDTNENICV
jgi:pyruvate dehydrogenase kinase 2/3/4